MRLEALLVLVLIFVGGLIYYKDGDFTSGLKGTNASTTSSSFFSGWFSDDAEETDDSETDVEEENSTEDDVVQKPTAVTVKPIETPEIEVEVDEIFERINELEAEARTNKLLAPVSPYAASVTLKTSGAKATDPHKEYLTLNVSSGISTPINITGWSVESYVTDSEGKIPKGSRFLMTRTAKTSENILLRAGEVAHLITGETPINVSFKENECSGYLTNYDEFTPGLKKSCSLASDELLMFSSIKTSDDECYEFVANIKQCQIIDDEKIDDEDLTSSCEDFIEEELTYNGCVANHKDDSTFATGDWRIYLNKRGELWRSKKEIIRLLDENERVVAVVEY